MAFLNCPAFGLVLASILAIIFAAPSPKPGILDLFYNSAEKQYRISSLPSVNFRVPNSWAGLHPVGPSHGSDSLFFWLWQADSIIPSRDLIIWFQGGPACSSLLGLFKENGPVVFPSAETNPKKNEFAWARAANVLYVDQPIGTGFSNGSTTDSMNNDANTAVVVAWLDNFFKTFPLLRYARIHLAGESYAGVFLPYIAKAIQDQKSSLGFHVTSLSMGNAAWGNGAALTAVVANTYLKAHQGSVGAQIPADIEAVLEQADQDCGFKGVLSKVTYPSLGPIIIPGNPEYSNYKKRDSIAEVQQFEKRDTSPVFDPDICDFEGYSTTTAAQVSFLINGTGPTCYGSCATFDSAYNYLADIRPDTFNAYNIDELGYGNLYNDDAWVAYLNRADVRTAIHAPSVASITFQQCNSDIQQTLTDDQHHQIPPAYAIIPALLGQGVAVNIYSGDRDYVLPAPGNEVAIQNMTWGGKQGFASAPTKQYSFGRGNVERKLSYTIFEGAGHRVPQDAPEKSLWWLKERVLGH